MDLREDIRNEVLNYLPNDKDDPAISQELSGKSARELLGIYMNWINRMIHPHPRTVHLSKDLCANPIWNEYRADAEALLNKITAGEEIKPHLSKGIDCVYAKSDPLNNVDSVAISGHTLAGNFARLNKDRADLDLMLNQWGIHHLHISSVLDSEGFVRRDRQEGKDEPLLFVFFKSEDAYILDLGVHGDWANEHLLEVAHRNWPEVKLVWFLPGYRLVVEGNAGYEEVRIPREGRLMLRNRGVNTGVQTADGLFLPQTAISRAGTSSEVERKADRIWNGVALFEMEMEKPTFRQFFEERTGKPCPEMPSFRFRFVTTPQEYAYAIWEDQTGPVIWL
jgi:hypothetical protein